MPAFKGDAGKFSDTDPYAMHLFNGEYYFIYGGGL
jgi:hypothetical protein